MAAAEKAAAQDATKAAKADAKAEAAASLAALVVHNSANQGAVAQALVSMLRCDLEGGRLTPLIASDLHRTSSEYTCLPWSSQ